MSQARKQAHSGEEYHTNCDSYYRQPETLTESRQNYRRYVALRMKVPMGDWERKKGCFGGNHQNCRHRDAVHLLQQEKALSRKEYRAWRLSNAFGNLIELSYS
jgi:hypothetical protein